jgi:malonyl-CoA/methylmalonyl-CoA synthetase
VAINSSLLTGGSMIFLPHFDPKTVIDCIPHATLMMGVPTYYTRLLNTGLLSHSKCKNMRLFISGSAPLSINTFNDFRQATNHEIVERYGMTETLMNTSNPVDGRRKSGSVGLPLQGISIRISNPINEVGELEIKGPNLCMGYWRKEEDSKQSLTVDGFFKTGDQAREDADGYITIVGRKTDLIITGGLNVYPVEVEKVINDIKGVVECAIVGIPDDDFGEVVTAIVVRKDDSQLNENEIIELAKQKLASYKVPKAVFFVSTLPRNTMGKIQKNIIKQQFKK